MTIKEKLYNFTEEIIVALVMLFVFLPVRVLFVNYVSDNWFGSFGVISAIVVALVLLSKYQKLGTFGKMYWRTITKLHKGKRRIISYLSIAFMVYFWGFSIVGVNYAEENQEAIKTRIDVEKELSAEDKQVLDRLEQSIENKDVRATSQELENQLRKMPIVFILIAVPVLLAMPLIDLTVWAVLTSILNDFTKGWYLHFATVFFIESLEVVGIMIYTFFMTRIDKKSKKQYR